GEELPVHQTLKDNESLNLDVPVALPQDYPISQPYWIAQEPKNNLFQIGEQSAIGQPFNTPSVVGKLTLLLEGMELVTEIPLKYKYNDQVDGEINQPFTVIPAINISISKDNVFVLNNKPDKLEVEVGFEGDLVEGELIFEGLPSSYYQELGKRIDLGKKKIHYQIQLNGLPKPGSKDIYVKYKTADGEIYDKSMKRISYKHIPNLTYFPASSFKLINLELSISPQKIGYIPGAGDDVPGILT